MSLLLAKAKLVQLGNLRQLLLAAMLVAPSFSIMSQAQQATTREIVFPVSIRWNREPAVKRYRLQIAADEKFQNVFLDRRVVGDRYTVNELSAGYYYWRVAPADSQLGSFSRPVRFFISGGTVTPITLVRLPSRAPKAHSSPPLMGRKLQFLKLTGRVPEK